MNEHTEIELRRALRTWQARQRMDGYLVMVAVVLALFPVLHFLLSPARAAAWTMGLFLALLVLACIRLLRSAAKVAALQHTLCPKPVAEVVEAEIVDPAD
jgi:hypothetical protein